ncbi:MAG: hypothetical protein KatS3mg108_1803 [Isosphaeraceae bacterium]|jgi:2-polyprenyl-6-hydroxyphenyl methylase/3-demethylubiquinone-9 3-methyltransferase|nr:MAG: hypothetical protein KatS3mg108_1803 [Isosphaeraceae bacterium]
MSVASAEAFVRTRFDQLAHRFRDHVADHDVRLRALVTKLGVAPGMRLLDLGCGKGRFASGLVDYGAEVWGLDASSAMLAAADRLPRVRATARRIPFPAATFDGAYAVEVFEHLHPRSLDRTLAELARVVRAGGRVVIIDKNRAALDTRRPWLPAAWIKWIDERRGRWMYHPSDPVREHWFSAGELAGRMACHLAEVRWDFLLRPEEARHAVFRLRPSARLFIVWSGMVP